MKTPQILSVLACVCLFFFLSNCCWGPDCFGVDKEECLAYTALSYEQSQSGENPATLNDLALHAAFCLEVGEQNQAKKDEHFLSCKLKKCEWLSRRLRP